MPKDEKCAMRFQDTEDPDDLEWRIQLARLALTTDSPKEFLDSALRDEKFNINRLFAYVRAFVRLAYLRDIEAAASELGTTRQWISRHILQFENLLGCKLFEVVGASSKLTDQGVLWLPRAVEIFEACSQVLTSRNALATDYKHVQVPLRYMAEEHGAPKLISDFKVAWMQGRQSIDCPMLQSFRPFWIVYERRRSLWYAREIGTRCSLSCWYGMEAVQKSIGVSVPEMISGMEFKDEVSFVLDMVYSRGGIHYSEVKCNLTRPGCDAAVPVRYSRALAELTTKDGGAVVASVIDAPHMYGDGSGPGNE